MAQRYEEMQFSIYGIHGYALVEGVTQFKYLVRPLDQYKNEWPEIIQNIRKAQKVCGQMGKVMR